MSIPIIPTIFVVVIIGCILYFCVDYYRFKKSNKERKDPNHEN